MTSFPVVVTSSVKDDRLVLPFNRPSSVADTLLAVVFPVGPMVRTLLSDGRALGVDNFRANFESTPALRANKSDDVVALDSRKDIFCNVCRFNLHRSTTFERML